MNLFLAVGSSESLFGIIFSIFVAISNLAFSLLDVLIILRVVASWVPRVRDVWIFRLAYTITEPMLVPFRNWLYRYDFARRCPLDLSFIALYISLGAAQTLLNVLNGVIK